jgi:NhaA family Na+:H+ antiporter
MTGPAVRTANPSFLHSDRALARATQPLVRFLHIEAAGGILLVAATVVALVWANSPWRDSYTSLWSTTIGIDVGSYRFEEDLAHVVNDLLMALFFFVVGMEIKRELVVGELRDRRAVALPAMAALGGMVVPAVIYAAFNAGGDGAAGWGIPMATDIAFALGIVALLGPRVPPSVKVLLLTLAIVDDIGAIAVIAIFYSDGLRPGLLLVAVAIAVVVAMMHRAQVIYAPLIVLAAIGLWIVVYESGVHATIAGVMLGLAVRRKCSGEIDANPAVIERLARALEPGVYDTADRNSARRLRIATQPCCRPPA